MAACDPDRDWLQFDCALSYGLVEYLRTLDVLKQNGWSRRRSFRTAAIRCRSTSRRGWASAATRSYPDVFRPFGGFADDTDIVDGRVRLFDGPGIGFEAKRDLFALLRKQLQA